MSANIKGMLAKIGASGAAAVAARPGANVTTPKPGGSSFMGLQLYAPAWFPAATFWGTAAQYAFYTTLTAFLLFIVLLLIHYAVHPIFTFTPGDGGYIPIPVFSDSVRAYTGTDKAVKAIGAGGINIDGLTGCSYTLSFDVYNDGVFTGVNKPRILLYRGAVAVTDIASLTTDTLATSFPNSNLVLYLDPAKNDMYLALITVPSGSTTPTVIGQSKPAIENIPIRKLFRVTITLSQTFAEVYMNGRLKKTIPFQGLLRSAAGENKFFGPIQIDTKLASMTYWPRILTAGEIHADGVVQTTLNDIGIA